MSNTKEHSCKEMLDLIHTGHGEAIDEIVYDEEKSLWFATNHEYSTSIEFCPWCGQPLSPINSDSDYYFSFGAGCTIICGPDTMQAGCFTFRLKDDEENILKFCPDGNFTYRGKTITSDKELHNAFRLFLHKANLLMDTRREN